MTKIEVNGGYSPVQDGHIQVRANDHWARVYLKPGDDENCVEEIEMHPGDRPVDVTFREWDPVKAKYVDLKKRPQRLMGYLEGLRGLHPTVDSLVEKFHSGNFQFKVSLL